MKKTILKENIRPLPNEPVRFKDMGNIKEIMYSKKHNFQCHILKLNSEMYVDLNTGEVKNFEHIENRADDKNSVRTSIGRLRDVINTNVINTEYCLWVTLTYAENMTDTKQLYEDFKKFTMRMRYNKYDFEYIVAMEPQGRGAWHAHLIMIFKEKAPFIPNEKLSEIWGHGFVKVKKLDDVDNVGAYLTAYLGDMDFAEFKKAGFELEKCKAVKWLNTVDESGNAVPKAIVKGARLVLYPPKFNLYRCSRGIKKPAVEKISSEDAEKKVSTLIPTFERTVIIEDEQINYDNILNYRYFNTLKTKKQE